MKNIKEELIKHFYLGCNKNKNLGLELEHVLIDSNGFAISYFGDDGIENLLNKLSLGAARKDFSDNHLIGYKKDAYSVTLEPAAQLEVSIDAFENIIEIEKQYRLFEKEVLSKINPDWSIKTYGYQLSSKASTLSIIPKKRYHIMQEFFKQTGKTGINMMRASCATQISIDYSSEKDFAKKYFLANCITPIIVYLCDNSPVFESNIVVDGIGTKKLSKDILKNIGKEKKTFFGGVRNYIWSNLDANRCGFVKDSFERNMSFETYANFVLQSKPMFLQNSVGDCKITDNKTVAEVFENGEFSKDDIVHVLSMVFPHNRLKQFIEIRMCDSMPIEYALGLCSLYKGIYYSDNLELFFDIFKNITLDIAQKIYYSLYENGLSSIYTNNMSVKQILEKLFDQAAQNIKKDEVVYLQKLYSLMSVDKRPLCL